MGIGRDALSPIFKLGVKGSQLISCQFLEFFLPIQAAEHCLTLGSSVVCTTKSVRHRAPFMELPHWTSWEKPGVQSLRKILRCRLISSSVWLSGYLCINPFIEPFQGELESRVSSNSALKCGAPGFRFNIPIYCWPSRFPYGAYHKVSCPLCFFSWMFAGMSQSFHVIYEQPRGKKSVILRASQEFLSGRRLSSYPDGSICLWR